MQDDRLEKIMLFDFYGELLTSRQRECFDLYHNEDLSLAELSERFAISRQAVWDNLKRAEQYLRDIERKTGLIARAETRRLRIEQIEAELRELAARIDDTVLERVLTNLADLK